MKFLQNLLMTNNVWAFSKVFFGLESGKEIDFTLKNVCFISKLQYLDFLVSCLYTFNPLSLSLKWVTILVATTWRVGSPAKLPTWWRQRGQRGYQLFLALDWILFCTIHIKELKLSWKSRNRNKMFQVTLSKALAEFCYVCWRHQLYLKETVLHES